MFLFGHIGIGRTIARPWSRGLPAVPLIVGTILPDLIDKPLYYWRAWAFVSCTRTFGHTGLFLVAIAVAARLMRSRVLAAVAVGVATHLVLDCLLDVFSGEGQTSAWTALTWPFLHRHFTSYTFASVPDHLESLWVTPVILCEIVGLALIGWDVWRRRV